MAYEKITKKFKEYSGESFAQSLGKDNASKWLSNEIATYTMVDSEGTVISSGPLEISTDNKKMSFLVGSSITTSLLGDYKIFVDLHDTVNKDISDVIAEYGIAYSSRKA